MDPVITTIVTALVAGAAAGANEVSSTAVKDAYQALKRLVSGSSKSAGPFVLALEAEPRAVELEQALTRTLVANPPPAEANVLAADLLARILELPLKPEHQALFDFKKLRAAQAFELRDIHAKGTVLRADEAVFEGPFSAVGINGGATDSGEKKRA